ncbi:MAG: TIGR04255 family protein [Deltaproteobacteria bacterium]|nr:TIGR04255 family protein [Candidatus Zymogenaceae bacterium]
MYKEIQYKKTYLKEVIVRIDFSAHFKNLQKNMPTNISNKVLERFSISEPANMIAQEFQVSPKGVKQQQEHFMQWNYYGRNREKRLTIDMEKFFISYSRYSNFEELKEDFLGILDLLFKEDIELRGKRLGLRYINNIKMKDCDPFNWEKYIDKKLLCLFNRFHDERSSITRIFHVVEYKHDNEIQVKFQFGVPNPDFPAKITRPLFVLDIDAYIQELLDFQQIKNHLENSHDYIQRLFEQSITSDLREIMNEEE